jgi:hypothetical protein
MLGEQQALQAAASGFPVVIAKSDHANRTTQRGAHPTDLMLQYFLSRRVQIYSIAIGPLAGPH